jgi:hypothetical protein
MHQPPSYPRWVLDVASTVANGHQSSRADMRSSRHSSDSTLTILTIQTTAERKLASFNASSKPEDLRRGSGTWNSLAYPMSSTLKNDKSRCKTGGPNDKNRWTGLDPPVQMQLGKRKRLLLVGSSPCTRDHEACTGKYYSKEGASSGSDVGVDNVTPPGRMQMQAEQRITPRPRAHR